MAHLINCFECGEKISSEALKCPKCSTPAGGYKCKICKMVDKKANLIVSYEQDHGCYCEIEWSHPQCIKKVTDEYDSFRCTCALCKQSWHPKDRHVCPECGHPFKQDIRTNKCYICRKPLFHIAAVKRSYWIDGEENADWIHKLCYEHSAYKLEQEKKDEQAKQTEKNSNCFIATTLYGEDSSKVRMLCFFRDEYLSATSLGRAFIALYVRFSPPLARAIAKKSLLRTLVRYCIVAPALLFTEKFLAYAGRKDKLKH